MINDKARLKISLQNFAMQSHLFLLVTVCFTSLILCHPVCGQTLTSNFIAPVELSHQENILNPNTNLILKAISNFGYGVQDTLVPIISTDQQLITVQILIEQYVAGHGEITLPSYKPLALELDLGKFQPGQYTIDFFIGPTDERILSGSSSFIVAIPEPSTTTILVLLLTTLCPLRQRK